MIGDNAGAQPNVLIFELVMQIDDATARLTGADVITVAIHPFLVSPESWGYTNPSRSVVGQTLTRSYIQQAGKGLRTGNFSGTFGVEDRAAGIFFGTGDVRFQRFYREIVRLSEAISQADVTAAKNLLTESPGLSNFLKAYIPNKTVFAINFYDLWHDVSFAATVPAFGTTRGYNRGGAVGMTWYNLTVQEAGPIIRGSPATSLISGIMDGLTTWRDLTDLLESLDVSVILSGVTGLVSILAAQFQAAVDAIAASAASVRQIFGASSSTNATVETGTAYLAAAETAQATGLQLANNLLHIARPDTQIAMPANIAISTISTRMGPEAVLLEQLHDILDAVDRSRLSARMGRLFGLDDASFQTLVVTGGQSAQSPGLLTPNVSGSRQHVIEGMEMPAYLEALYGVSFDRILATNNLTAYEALMVGTVLTIPTLRPRGPIGTAGLPVLGDQSGLAAYGVDIAIACDAEPRAETFGMSDLRLVRGTDCLQQGLQISTEQEAIPILAALQRIPGEKAQRDFLQRRLSDALIRDPRLERVDVTATTNSTGTGYEVEVNATAITGSNVASTMEIGP